MLPDSLYAETARPPIATPELEGEHRVSVAVIGAGFTGLSTALHLAEQGVDVAVLDAHEPGWGASGRNGGQVNPGLKNDPDQIEQDFGTDLGRRMVAFSGAAPNKVFELIERHQITCDARQSGTLRAAYHARTAADIRASAAQGARRGMPVELLEAEAVRAATGTDRYVAALLDRRGGQVNPLGYARGLAQAAVQAGARVHGQSPVEKLRRESGSWVARTAHGALRAEKIVLATNGYTDTLWHGLARSIVPVFSGIVATAPLPDALAEKILPARSVIYELGSITVYYRLDPQNRLLMGGRSMTKPLSGPQNFRFLIRYAERLWPELKTITWTHGWNGQLAVTPDHYPHFHEPAPGVIACLGYNGRGVAMSTAMGGLAARRVQGARAEDLDMPVTTIKEIAFHHLWRHAVDARVAYGRIRDFLHV